MEPQSPYCLCLGPCQKDTSPLLPRQEIRWDHHFWPQNYVAPRIAKTYVRIGAAIKGNNPGNQPSGKYTWICNTVLNACIITIFGRRSLRHRTKTSPLWYSQRQTPSNGSSFYRWKQPMCETPSGLVQSSGFSSNKKPHNLTLLRAVGWFSLQKGALRPAARNQNLISHLQASSNESNVTGCILAPASNRILWCLVTHDIC